MSEREPTSSPRIAPGTWRYKLIALPGQLLIRAFEAIITLLQGNASFYDPKVFPWVAPLEANEDKIRAELLRLLERLDTIPELKAVSKEQERITEGASWKTFFFWTFGHRVDHNCERCPATAELVEAIPGMTQAFFSILAPGTRITPHRGPFKGVLRYHLALVVPPDPTQCGLLVGDETRHWHPSESLIFDDTHEHSAWNESDQVRVVLFVDFLRELPWPISWLNRGMIALLRVSPFVQNIVTGLDAFEREVALRD